VFVATLRLMRRASGAMPLNLWLPAFAYAEPPFASTASRPAMIEAMCVPCPKVSW
jgi:hypothetical protein